VPKHSPTGSEPTRPSAHQALRPPVASKGISPQSNPQKSGTQKAQKAQKG
jgi:hypothetical protein